MKFSNFLFPQVADPADDERLIDETMAEAKLCDELGIDTVWLAEHHFDGNCAYVDPVSFAAAIAAVTTNVKIGFAVAQMSLHHPIRMAEQMSMIDNLSKGRLIVGLGRGTAYNIYDYLGFDIDPDEAYERLLEAEEIMIKAWTTEDYEHKGKYWNLWLPALRPKVFTKPHPFMIRACSGEESMLGQAKEGKPFLMNVQSVDVIRDRMDAYRTTMRDAGFDEAHVQQCVDQSWIWKNIFVAESDAEAEKVGVPLFEAQRDHRMSMRKQVYESRGLTLDKSMETGAAPKAAARNVTHHSLLCGSPATVAEQVAEIDAAGVGGLILQFRLGPASHEVTENSIRLFMEKVAPEFEIKKAA
ncbi:MAG: LLM class flavin-dependent oxidoreductase [Alphaproteobacteria bacterium]|tara:strand:+ start:455 stop:1522 length:1068 start_codon:yes stop_codon:yes gene_type:complete